MTKYKTNVITALQVGPPIIRTTGTNNNNLGKLYLYRLTNLWHYEFILIFDCEVNFVKLTYKNNIKNKESKPTLKGFWINTYFCYLTCCKNSEISLFHCWLPIRLFHFTDKNEISIRVFPWVYQVTFFKSVRFRVITHIPPIRSEK